MITVGLSSMLFFSGSQSLSLQRFNFSFFCIMTVYNTSKNGNCVIITRFATAIIINVVKCNAQYGRSKKVIFKQFKQLSMDSYGTVNVRLITCYLILNFACCLAVTYIATRKHSCYDVNSFDELVFMSLLLF